MKATDEIHIGTWMSAGSPVLTELAVECGLRWLLLDLEHGQGEASLPDMLRALRGSDTLGIVRVPALQSDVIARVLDWGAVGIMLPHTRSAEEAADCVAAMRYPPRGHRGVSRTVRAYGYGTREFTPLADAIFLPQIEDLTGVKAAHEIAHVEGVTALFVGPADLRHSLAHSEGEDVPDYETSLEIVLDAAFDASRGAGLLLRDESLLSSHLDRGFRWIAIQSDLGILRDAYLRLSQLQKNTPLD